MATHVDDNDDQVADVLLVPGKIQTPLGHQHEAERDWRHCVSLNNTLAEGWYLLARAYQARGEAKPATEALAQFKKIKSEM